jgi:hypothetical protein
LKPFAWLIGAIVTGIVTILFRLFATIYIVAGNSLVFFLGFRPKPFGKSFKKLFDGEGVSWDRAGYGEYKLWRDRWTNEEQGGPRIDVKMPIAPWEVCLIAISGFAIFKLLAYLWEDVWATIFLLAGVGVLAAYSLIYFFKAARWFFAKLPGKSDEEKARLARERGERGRQKEEAAAKRKKERADKAIEVQVQRTKVYEDWLAKNYSIDRKPIKVNLANLPVPLAKTERVAQVFRVSFWALKAKICRPYSR